MAKQSTTFTAIGTHWTIDALQPLEDQAWSKLCSAIEKRIEMFDETYSRFRSDSLITHMAKRAGDYKMPSDAKELLLFYRQLYDITDGLVTPTIGSVIAGLGYDESYSFQEKADLAPALSWDEAINYHEPWLTVKKPVQLDFGAAGKGYLVDIVGAIIESFEVFAYVINAGGDIRCRPATNEPIMIGLENPLDGSEVIGAVALGRESLCASAASKRAWGKYHHIVHPSEAASTDTASAVWVMAESTMLADGLATALFFTPPERLMQKFKFEYAILKPDMSLQYSRNFPITVYEGGGH